MGKKYRVLALGDLHFPFHSPYCLTRVYDAIEALKPDVIIQIGDVFDFYSQSRFPKHPLKRMSAMDEVAEALQCYEELWRVCKLKAPKAKLIQILGNHDIRPIKKAAEMSPDLLPFVTGHLTKIFEMPGVEVIHDYSDFITINGVAYHHGFKTKPLDHARHFERSAVFGHTHRAWIAYEPINGKLRFDASIGYLADPTHPALKYRETKIHKWVHGFAMISGGDCKFYRINVPEYNYKPIKIFSDD